MFAILHVLKDALPVKLCFYNKRCAETFLTLVNTYEDDSGAGNGYGVYWPNYNNRKVSQRLWVPSDAVTELDSGMVKQMIRDIYLARDIVPPEDMDAKFCCLYTDGAIAFFMNELPPRVRPTVGDMYRIPRSLSVNGMGDEGRVIGYDGYTLEIIPCWYWGREGFRHDVKVLKVDASKAMKIHDWLKDVYPERTSWEFDPSKIRGTDEM